MCLSISAPCMTYKTLYLTLRTLRDTADPNSPLRVISRGLILPRDLRVALLLECIVVVVVVVLVVVV